MNKNNDIVSRKEIIKILTIVLTNWYIILGVPIIFFAGAYVYTHRIQDVYAAKCQVLLKSNETYDYQQQIYRGLGFNSKYASYEETASQMRVITSSGLIENVLNRIPLSVSYYIVGRLKVTEVYKHLPFKVISDDRSASYSGMPFDLSIIDQNTYRLKYEKGGVSKDKTYRFDELILEDGLFLKIIKQPNLTKTSVKSLSEINYMFKVYKHRSLISRYKAAISVSNIDYTSIVEISLKDQIPERAEEVLDTLAKLYVLNTVSNKTEINDNTLGYIDKQLNEVIGIINEIEEEIELYKETKDILNLVREEESHFARLVEQDNSLRELRQELLALDDLTSYLLQNEDVESLLPPSLFVENTDQVLRNNVEELYELRDNYSSLLKSGTKQNLLVEDQLIKIESLKRDILTYVESQKIAIADVIKRTEEEIGALELKIKAIPKTQRQLLNIERRLVVNEELYSFLLSKRAETIIAKAGLIPDTKIIERARSVGIVYPDKKQINLMAILIGLAVAALAVFVRVFFFQTISSLGELQAATDISILGSIPKKKDFSKTYRIQTGSDKSDIVQAFRTLRTNLQYFIPSDGGKRILVTSILPGEGKTFTSVNLASILAIADKKVLLMDFDMHKPRLAKAMELENDRGVSSYLIGQKSISDIVQHTEIPTLDVITSGPVPPNASELVMRKELDALLAYADEHYDFVFLDTPPTTLITDGILLMNKVDVKLFVLNSKFTSQTSIDYIERMIESNNLSSCALILNEEKVSRISYYYSRYGYGGYGYGYGGYGYGGYGSGGYYGNDEGSK